MIGRKGKGDKITAQEEKYSRMTGTTYKEESHSEVGRKVGRKL